MAKQLEKGDYVKHKSKEINGGAPMSVEDLNISQVLCSHFISHNGAMKTEWFDLQEVEEVVYGEDN